MDQKLPECTRAAAGARSRIWDEHREQIYNGPSPKTPQEWRTLTEELFEDAATVTRFLDQVRPGLYTAVDPPQCTDATKGELLELIDELQRQLANARTETIHAMDQFVGGIKAKNARSTTWPRADDHAAVLCVDGRVTEVHIFHTPEEVAAYEQGVQDVFRRLGQRHHVVVICDPDDNGQAAKIWETEPIGSAQLHLLQEAMEAADALREATS